MLDTNGFIIVERIDKRLKEMGQTRVDMCKAISLPTSNISGWSRRGSIPPADVLLEIADYLNLDYRYLITGQIGETSPQLDSINFDLQTKFMRLNELDRKFVLSMLDLLYSTKYF